MLIKGDCYGNLQYRLDLIIVDVLVKVFTLMLQRFCDC
jgi:hypothetical protein